MKSGIIRFRTFFLEVQLICTFVKTTSFEFQVLKMLINFWMQLNLQTSTKYLEIFSKIRIIWEEANV